MPATRRDHPRACGEHSLRDTLTDTVRGSSPRLRGTLTQNCQTTSITGIIPALAGNTWRLGMRRALRRDHPRACGEHRTICVVEVRGGGSSPRLRGTRTESQGRHRQLGIIPALAGNTKGISSGVPREWDHPRACGEHVTVPQDAILTAGSSPRLRGTLVAVFSRAHNPGIIPALAGNT